MIPCSFGWVTCSEASLGSSSSRFDTTIRQVSSGENPGGELKQVHYAGCGECGSSLSGPIDRWRRKSRPGGWIMTGHQSSHGWPRGCQRMATGMQAAGSPLWSAAQAMSGALKYEGPCARAAAISSSCPGRAFRYTPTTDLHLPEDGEWQEPMSRDCPDQAIPIMDGMVLTAEKFSVVCFSLLKGFPLPVSPI